METLNVGSLQRKTLINLWIRWFHWLYVLNSSGNLVIESKPTPGYTPNVVVGQVPPGTNHISKTPGQINLAQLRLQHMQQQVYAQKHQQLQQMRMQQPPASVPTTTTTTQQHPRQAAPQMLQQQVSAVLLLAWWELRNPRALLYGCKLKQCSGLQW